jgi:hypothetical protein
VVLLKATAQSTKSVPTERIDVFGGLKPNPTQAAFLISEAPFKDYCGAFGSGKTEVLIWQAIILSNTYPPNRGLVGRFAYPDLRDTTRKRFMDICPPKLIKNAHIPQTGDGFIEWQVGGTTLFRNLDQPEKFGSLSLGYFCIDESSECPESVWNFLEGRVGRHWTDIRASKPHPYSPGCSVGNPGGRDWRWKKFHSPGHRQEYAGFTPGARENEQNLPAGYYDRLALGKPAWWVARYVQGKLGAMEGLVWPVWDDALHLVRPFPIPKDWRRITGHDHGRRNPTACLWVATDYDGNLVAYREYENSGPTVKEHCMSILGAEARTQDRIERRLADPSMFAKTMTNYATGNGSEWWSVAEEYELCGISLDKGDNALTPSLERVNALLWPDPAHVFPDWHPRRGTTGSPRLFFFDTLERTAACCSAWRFPDVRETGVLAPSEKPIERDDHLPDCLRYIATSFPEPSMAEKPRKEPTIAEWQIARRKQHYRAAVQAALPPSPKDDYV